MPIATLDDLRWADGFAFGTPSRFGTPAAQLKQFIDTAGGLWAEGALADKAATVFGSADNAHGGVESTLLGLSNVFYHWGAVLVPPGYTDDSVAVAGGNPYGTTHVSGGGAADLDAVLAAARHQGARLARVAAVLRQLRQPRQQPRATHQDRVGAVELQQHAPEGLFGRLDDPTQARLAEICRDWPR